MQFSSVLFLFLVFPISILGYHVCRSINGTLSKVFLTAVSLAFYGWACVPDIFKLLLFILGVYLLGLVFQMMSVYREKGRGTTQSIYKIIGASICLVLLPLLFYKYLNFMVQTVNALFGTGFSGHTLTAPLGISYLVFSAISFLVDVYRGDARSVTLLDTALYLSFFPKVASGPILLYREFTPPPGGWFRRMPAER